MLGEAEEPRSVVAPLTRQDIFAYLIPGTTFIVLTYAYDFWYRLYFAQGESRARTPIFTALRSIEVSDNWAFMILYLLAVLSVAYVAGHVIAWIAVFFVDRLLIAKGHNYPHRTLLGFKEPSTGIVRSKRYAYQALFLWASVYVLLRYLSLLWPQFEPLAEFLGWAVVLMVLFKLSVSAVLTHYSPNLSKAFWQILALPYTLLTNFLGKVTRTSTPFHDDFVRLFTSHFEATFGVKISEAGTGLYWFPLIYLEDKAPTMSARVAHWHHLYSFTRNLSAAFFLAFLYCLAITHMQQPVIDNLDLHQRQLVGSLPITYFAAALLLLSRFYYLYVSKHTRLLLRYFVYLSGRNPRQTVRLSS